MRPAELESVRSVDEFQVGLGGTRATLDGAFALARRIKSAIREQVGSELQCSIGVHLGEVIRLEDRNGDLFAPLSPGRANRSERLCGAVDRLNRRFGTRVVKFGVQREHPGFFEKG